MSTDRGVFELIDTESANLVGDYESEAAALRDVLATVEAYGVDSPEVRSLALVRLDVPREQGHLAAGADLASRALACHTPSARNSAAVAATGG